MKKYLSFLFVLLMAIGSLTLAGCSSDDHSDENNWKAVVGSWRCITAINGGYYDWLIRFYEDGAYVGVYTHSLYTNETTRVIDGKWTVSDGKLFIQEDYGTQELFTSRAKLLSTVELALTDWNDETHQYSKIDDSVFDEYYNAHK